MGSSPVAVIKYQALEAFEAFRRSASMSIQEFLNEFDERQYKMKSYGTVQSDDILSYCLSYLCNNYGKLIKATIPELKYDPLKDIPGMFQQKMMKLSWQKIHF